IYAISKGLDRSIDGGSTWETLLNERCSFVAVDPLNSEILYVSSEGKILKSGDSGGSWSNVSPGKRIYSSSRGYISIDPVQTDTIYVGIYNTWWPTGFYRSYNGGASWDSLWVQTEKIAINPVNRNNIYAPLRDLWKSSDRGNNWYKTNGPKIANIIITDININPDYPERMLIGTFRHGFFRTSDGGDSWEQKNTGLADSLVRVKDIFRAGDKFYVAFLVVTERGIYKNSGVYTSSIDTIKWIPIGEHDYFKDIGALSIAYLKSHDKVLVGTDLAGIYSYTKTSVGIKEDEIENFSRVFLEQNYPNPFNQNTTIRYSIPILGNVKLRIYDVRGREIATLVNQEQQAGSYEVGFNMTGFPSGIYFCKLHAGRFIQTRKMILQ
ncbi:MAG: T9SS C-terminal target domain-containing protein, partial [Calditrichaeota bacterium]